MITPVTDCCRQAGTLRAAAGIMGVALAGFFMAWLLLGWVGWVPAMADIFGIEGMRTPAAFTVGGLLLAAIAFWEC
jgi:hypothetical protein